MYPRSYLLTTKAKYLIWKTLLRWSTFTITVLHLSKPARTPLGWKWPLHVAQLVSEKTKYSHFSRSCSKSVSPYVANTFQSPGLAPFRQLYPRLGYLLLRRRAEINRLEREHHTGVAATVHPKLFEESRGFQYGRAVYGDALFVLLDRIHAGFAQGAVQYNNPCVVLWNNCSCNSVAESDWTRCRDFPCLCTGLIIGELVILAPIIIRVNFIAIFFPVIM